MLAFRDRWLDSEISWADTEVIWVDSGSYTVKADVCNLCTDMRTLDLISDVEVLALIADASILSIKGTK